MTSATGPAFSSPELQAAFDKVRETLAGADEARNRVSQDIKALESYLIGLKLTPPFRFSLGKLLIPEDESNVAASLEYGGCANGKIQEDALLLDKDASGKLRLLYEVSRWEGYVDVDAPGGPYFWDSNTCESEVKPLIETRFEVRKKAYNRLVDFVAALGQHYAINPWQSSGITDIPF